MRPRASVFQSGAYYDVGQFGIGGIDRAEKIQRLGGIFSVLHDRLEIALTCIEKFGARGDFADVRPNDDWCC